MTHVKHCFGLSLTLGQHPLPLLFLIYMNDLDDNITSNVLKFADDIQVFRKVNTDGDKHFLRLNWTI